jgi:glycosidase
MKRAIFIIFGGINFLSCRVGSNIQIIKEKKMSFKMAEWIKSTNVYEVNLRQYTREGSFNAFAKELPRLKEMGVETIWLMPITPIAQKNKKGSLGSYYACSDYTSVNTEFGTLDDFKSLVRQAHEMGMKVIMDWVANHTGWDHTWTTTHPQYYKKDSTTNDFKIASGMDDIIELDYKNPALRHAMTDAMLYWVKECDIDGYRCDLAFWVELDFWKEARTAIEKIKTIFWLAENDPLEHPDYYEAFDACYTWTWMHKTEDYYKKTLDLNTLDTVLNQYDAVAGENKIPLWFTTNHDENSWNGTEYEKYGNAAKALAVFSFTYNGIPLIYSGQELPNKKRLKFFDKDVIDWNGKFELREFYKTLLTIRKDNTALISGDKKAGTLRIKTNAGEQVIAYLRKNGNDEVLVMLNLSRSDTEVSLESNEMVKGKFSEIFSNTTVDFDVTGRIPISPWGFLVFARH